MQDCPDGWMNEFEEDSWYELIPLDSSNHYVSIETAIDLVEMWNTIKKEKDGLNKPCYWKDGFVPLLQDQYFGLVVLDTKGYFNGDRGQLVYFDYKCSDGYTVIHENIYKWMETNIELIKKEVFYTNDSYDEINKSYAIKDSINGGYISRFKNPIPLD